MRKTTLGGKVFRGALLVAFGLFFLFPLYAMADFSTRNLIAGGRTLQAWKNLVADDALYQAIVISLLLAVFTVVLMLAILVPTMIWVRLRAPWARGIVEFLCLLPLTIPALVIVVGLRNVYLWVTYFLGESALTLTFVYVVLVLPFAYRALDAALSAIDLKTLSEAARSLGAGWATTIARVVVPNIWSGILSAAFISIAVVLGEYTIASLSGFETLQVQIVLIGKSDGPTSVAASLATLVFGFVLLLVLALVTRGRRRSHRDGPGRRRPDSRNPTWSSDMTNGVSVELNDLTRVYGPVKALDGLTLHIEPGELVALLGPSGCGKTTALRILAGLDEATSGTVSVDGKDLTRVPANKRDMGMVFQAYSLFPHLTVLDNVAFGLKMRGKDKGQRSSRAEEMLELVGLTAHRHKYASELSGGQQQRVALARALAIQPRVLLLDEPLSALDAKVRVQLRDEIRRVQLEVGTTTLFVTHDQEEALAVADRVGVMSQGKLEQLAAPAELYANPATPFVAEFVGLNNKVPADVSDGQAQLLGASVPALPGSVSTGAGLAMVRPESVTVDADPAGTASVTSVAFLGPISRVYCTLADGTVVGAQMASSAARAFGPGDPVTVGVEPTGVLVVEAAG